MSDGEYDEMFSYVMKILSVSCFLSLKWRQVSL